MDEKFFKNFFLLTMGGIFYIDTPNMSIDTPGVSIDTLAVSIDTLGA